MSENVLYRVAFRRFRSRRLSVLYRVLPITAETRIVDVGGSPYFWNAAYEEGFPSPKVTIVNTESPQGPLPANIEWVVADGTELPFPAKSFDIAFSNSVIEHLAELAAQQRFASELARVASRYFIQTPDADFFFEPHYIAPFVHWLPKRTQKRIVRNFTLRGILDRPSQQECDEWVRQLRLLSRDEMQRLFPTSQVASERFLGFSKSLLAFQAESRVVFERPTTAGS